MTISVATSEDLASVQRRINTLAGEIGKTTALVGEINTLKARVAALEGAVAHPLQVAEPYAKGSAGWDKMLAEWAELRAEAWRNHPPGPALVGISLDAETMNVLAAYIEARRTGWKEALSIEEAIRRMITDGLRAWMPDA